MRQSRPDAPSFEDYERIKPDNFGIGSLLGMGWKEGDPIGLTNRRFVALETRSMTTTHRCRRFSACVG
jgi:hypothetical protein